MMTEIDLISAITQRKIQHLSLFGDPQQNSPVVLSPYAKAMGLQKSLMERLIQCLNASGNKQLQQFLVKQRRMFPEIARLSQQYIYHAFNQGSAYEEIRVATRLIVQGIPASNITIITPYKADKFEIMLERAAQKQKMMQNQKTQAMTYNFNIEDLDALDIKVLDSFQGKENQIIIFCLVKSQPIKSIEQLTELATKTKSIGFLANPQRINVALTRASSGMIIIGNMLHIWRSREPLWRKIIADLVVNKHYYQNTEEFLNSIQISTNTKKTKRK